MTSLAGRTLIDTYKDLLQISNGNVGVDETARYIEDGEGTPSILSLSTTRVGVGTDTPQYTLDVAGDINMTGTFKVNGQDAVFSNWTVETDNSLSRATNVSITGDLDVSGTMSVANVFQVASDGAVGGVTPTTVGQILAWDGAKWVVANNAGASSSGSSTSEVPAAFSAALTSGQSVHTINFLQTYDVVPSVVTDLQITGDGDVIPYVITDVTTSSLTVTFTDNIPNNNYKLNVSFGGRDVYWSQDVLDRISYTAGYVGVGTTTPDSGLHVVGNSNTASQIHLQNTANATAGDFLITPNYIKPQLEFRKSDGTELMVITEEGKVGIGTPDPLVSTLGLHVNGTGTRSGIRIGGDNDTGSRIYIDSNGDDSYIDSYGLGAYQKLSINASQILLNSVVNSGDVGIGTTSPGAKLDVQGGYIHAKHVSGLANLRIGADGSNDIYMPTGQNLYISAADNISFKVGPSLDHRMFIDGSSGNVGINNDAPDAPLHVVGNVPAANTYYEYAGLIVRSTNNHCGVNVDAPEDQQTHIRFMEGGSERWQIRVPSHFTTSTDPMGPNSLRFYNWTTNTDVMGLDSEGNLGVGTTNPVYLYSQTSGSGGMSWVSPQVAGSRSGWTNASGGSLMVAHDADVSWSNVYLNRFNYTPGKDARFIDFLINGNSVGATISANSSANGVNYNTGSDRRLKGNIEDMTDGKDVVMQLRPRRFIWKSTHVEGDGFIADELSQVIPHAVTGEPDATNEDGTPRYQGVDYSKVVPVLTGALQQALQEIEQLKTRIETLENK